MRRKWFVSVAAFGLVGGSVLAATSVAAASTAPARAGQMTVQPGGLARHLSSPAGRAGANGVTSANWSGYAVHHGTYNTVSASWTEPAGHCSSGSQYSSFWVGLDGYGSRTVEQTGTDFDCHSGTPAYYGWYEMFPAASVRISHPVRPGDTMSASVAYNGGGSFTLTLTDSTQHWTATEHKSLAAATRSSAEVIIEAPSSFTGELPLADFGTAHFTSAKVDGSTIGSLSPTKITMVLGGRQLDKISALTGGTSFTGQWLAS